LKSANNEGQFTLEVGTVFRPYHRSHYRGVLEICQLALSAHALQAVEITLTPSVTKGTLLLPPKQFFVRKALQ
jgi:hypothetical protein